METKARSDQSQTPTVEVRVYRWNKLLLTELCESIDDAGSVIDFWSELEGVECEVDDLSARHRLDEILEPSDPMEPNEEYPREAAHAEEIRGVRR